MLSGARCEFANFEMKGNLDWSGLDPLSVSPENAVDQDAPPSSDRAKLLNCDPPIILFLSRLCQSTSKPSPANLELVTKLVAEEEIVPLDV